MQQVIRLLINKTVKTEGMGCGTGKYKVISFAVPTILHYFNPARESI